MTHTPGPWEIEQQQKCLPPYVVPSKINSNNFYCIAKLHGPDNQANARLIAAAPDLLAALEATLKHINDDMTRETVCAAIAKAKGI